MTSGPRRLWGWTLRPEYAGRIRAAVEHLRALGFEGPRAGIVLGSGLGNVVDRMELEVACSFGEIPGFHAPSVVAHSGRLLRARHENGSSLILQGRLHLYEGLPVEDVVLPILTLVKLGCQTILLTNAAGGLHADMQAGDLMAITGLLDLHLVDPGRTILVPSLNEPADPELALRCRTAQYMFDRRLSRRLVELAAASGLVLRTGTYASLWGPNYESPAEIGMLRRLGADAVGMSTGPEAALAHALGARVAGISCITNVAVEMGGAEVSHEEVIEMGRARREDLATLLLAALPELGS